LEYRAQARLERLIVLKPLPGNRRGLLCMWKLYISMGGDLCKVGD
jgi:hypothetical protein